MIYFTYNSTTNTIDEMSYSNINSSNVASVKAKFNYLMDVVNLDNNMENVVEDNNVIRSRQARDIEWCYLNHKSVNLRVKFNEVGNPQIQYKYEEDGSIWKPVNIKRKDENLSLSKGIRVTIPIKKACPHRRIYLEFKSLHQLLVLRIMHLSQEQKNLLKLEKK